MARTRSQADPFKDITWDDLHEWAGAAVVSRGQRYHQGGRVRDLARTSRGGLIAWVQGTRRYATRIETEDRELISACTCPYGGVCKHAVAVVLEYLEQVKEDQRIPAVTEQDHRLELLEGAADDDIVHAPRPTSRPVSDVAPGAWSEFLEQQAKPQLLALLKELAQRYPEVQEFLQDRHNLSAGAVPKLVKAVRVEIAALSEEGGWSHRWNDQGSIPDYSRVRDRLETLLAQGHADAVVDLGAELLRAGTRQVEMTDDEGETAEEIASCLDIVFRGLSQSSRSPAEQMRWAVEADLSDEYELCRGARAFWDRKHPVAAWNVLADQLARLLVQDRPGKSPDAFSETFRRDHLSNWLIRALEGAGRGAEIIPLCRQEAERTGSYLRLVEQLKKAKQWDDAEQWIRKGIAATEKRWPGIAEQLRTAFRGMRERQRKWLCVAALSADDFFVEPSLETFRELEKAAQRAGVWPVVRAAAMHYLETGVRPRPSTPPWPLPESELKTTPVRQPTSAPMTDPLIDIAIAERRPDEVLRWYDQRNPRSRSWDSGWFLEDRIAEAVVEAYPERAVAIWRRLAAAQVALTKPKAYEAAAAYLRKIRRAMKQSGKKQEWQSYLSGLRRANERKRALVRILDSLEGRRIIEGV